VNLASNCASLKRGTLLLARSPRKQRSDLTRLERAPASASRRKRSAIRALEDETYA
jgi:hypothetical protein